MLEAEGRYHTTVIRHMILIAVRTTERSDATEVQPRGLCGATCSKYWVGSVLRCGTALASTALRYCMHCTVQYCTSQYYSTCNGSTGQGDRCYRSRAFQRSYRSHPNWHGEKVCVFLYTRRTIYCCKTGTHLLGNTAGVLGRPSSQARRGGISSTTQ